MGNETGLPGGYSSSDLMTIAMAKELPQMESELAELKFRFMEVGYELRAKIGNASDERFASLVTESISLNDRITRLEAKASHARSCARYVVETLHREPW